MATYFTPKHPSILFPKAPKNLNRPLNPEQLKHSKKLVCVLQKIIEQAGGWISFQQFMQSALYEPNLGYYSAGTQKFGEAGDFITAPLLGRQFAYCLANQCQQVLNNISDENRIILEFGAGTGQLALDILIELEIRHALPEQYWILETSAELKARQKDFFLEQRPDLLKRVVWCEKLPTKKIKGVVIANEVLDAFPIKKFTIGSDSLAYEIGVEFTENEFKWRVSAEPLNDAIQQHLKPFGLPVGYQSELNTLIQPWLNALADALGQGVIILIDYGFSENEYFHPDRHDGTLMCHFQHQAHTNPFYYPGLQDMTAHVNFSEVAKYARQVHLEVEGYCSQAYFLLSLGLLDKVQSLTHDAMQTQSIMMLNQEIKTLTLPHEMGELFKTIALSKKFHQPLQGFTMQNNRGRL